MNELVVEEGEILEDKGLLERIKRAFFTGHLTIPPRISDNFLKNEKQGTGTFMEDFLKQYPNKRYKVVIRVED